MFDTFNTTDPTETAIEAPLLSAMLWLADVLIIGTMVSSPVR